MHGEREKEEIKRATDADRLRDKESAPNRGDRESKKAVKMECKY